MTIATITPAADPGDLPVADIPALTRIAVSEKVGPTVANRQPKALEKRTNTLVAKVNEIVTAINGQSYSSKYVPADASSLLLDSGITVTGTFSGGSYNFGVGYSALTKVTSGGSNVAVGPFAARDVTSGGSNTAVGSSALQSVTTGGTNTAIGRSAFWSVTLGSYNVGVGNEAGGYSTGSANCVLGYQALRGSTGITTGDYNCAFGYQALTSATSGTANTGVGYLALSICTTGGRNIAVGGLSLNSVVSSNYNTAIGYGSAVGHGTGNRNTYLGYFAGQTSDVGTTTESRTNCTLVGSFTSVTGDNQVQLGDSATTTYVYGTVQTRSDARDKADVRDTLLGLDFVSALRPVDFRWDYRVDYGEGGKDGSKKRSRFHHGLIAQEVAEVIAATGIDFGGYQNHAISGGDDVLSIGYEELVGPLIKSIQQLKALNDTLAARVTALESASKVAP